jgi:hypothetical protein
MTRAVCSTTCANLNRLGRHRMLRQRGRSKNCSHIALAAVYRRLSRFCTCRGEWWGRGSGPFHPGVDSDESVRARNAIHTKGLNLTLRCLRHPKVSGEGRAHACTRPSLLWKRGRHLRRRRGRMTTIPMISIRESRFFRDQAAQKHTDGEAWVRPIEDGRALPLLVCGRTQRTSSMHVNWCCPVDKECAAHAYRAGADIELQERIQRQRKYDARRARDMERVARLKQQRTERIALHAARRDRRHQTVRRHIARPTMQMDDAVHLIYDVAVRLQVWAKQLAQQLQQEIVSSEARREAQREHITKKLCVRTF